MASIRRPGLPGTRGCGASRLQTMPPVRCSRLLAVAVTLASQSLVSSSTARCLNALRVLYQPLMASALTVVSVGQDGGSTQERSPAQSGQSDFSSCQRFASRIRPSSRPIRNSPTGPTDAASGDSVGGEANRNGFAMCSLLLESGSSPDRSGVRHGRLQAMVIDLKQYQFVARESRLTEQRGRAGRQLWEELVVEFRADQQVAT